MALRIAVQDWSVTVLVPTYNHEHQIIEAMNGIVSQDIFSSIKVLVADDGSSDRTYPIACWYRNQYDNIDVVQNPHQLGVLGNYAALADRCQTEFIAVLEGDDVWVAADKLRRQIQFLQENSKVDACFTEYFCLEESTGTLFSGPKWADGRYKVLHLLDLLYENSPASFSTCLSCFASNTLI
ncbi:MAG TPA: glycosyltransferase family 2 protein, partial [Candidatus Melainabacteria bacterium]|nr:glycosyltransferase family 2 protein [Candidatus Melainabacteria bacterium]